MKRKYLLILAIALCSCASSRYARQTKLTPHDRQVAGRMTVAGLGLRLSINPQFP